MMRTAIEGSGFSHKHEMLMLTEWLAVSIGAASIFASRQALRSGRYSMSDRHHLDVMEPSRNLGGQRGLLQTIAFDLSYLVPALALTSAISAADAAQARSPGRDADLEQVVEYGATIANADMITSRQRRPFRVFPQAFHGRWAHVAPDCRASGFSAILSSAILSIDANGLRQGEGGFTVTSVIQARDNPRQISVSAHMSSGGREWDSLEQFTLSNDGQVIEWLRLEPASGPAIRLYRCK